MSAEQNYDPGSFRLLTAGCIKDLLAARAKTDPDFVTPEMHKRWGLDANFPGHFRAELYLDAARERLDEIYKWPTQKIGSLSPHNLDDANVKDAKLYVKRFVTSAVLQKALSAAENGQPIDWENGFRWDELDAIRDLLDRLPHPSPAADANEAEVIPAESDTGHSPDFRSVRWFGQKFKFTPMQAACIKLLYENWLNGTPVIGEQTILESVGSSSNHLRDVFEKKRHPAWGPMLRPARKGTFRLAKPDES